MRYTAKQLEQDVANHNKQAAMKMGSMYAAVGYSYGHTDLHRVQLGDNGTLAQVGMEASGSPKEAFEGTYRIDAYNKDLPAYIDRKRCKAIALLAGIDFTADPYETTLDQRWLLGDLALLSKYRRSGHSPMSTGTAFFVHLRDRVTIEPLPILVGLTENIKQ